MGLQSIFTDDLRQINIPTLLLTGDQERVINPGKVLKRARLMPNIEAEVIENAGHLMPVDQADAVNARMLRFLPA